MGRWPGGAVWAEDPPAIPGLGLILGLPERCAAPRWGALSAGAPRSQTVSLSSLCPRAGRRVPAERVPPAGKQLVHYTAQPLFLVDSSAVDVGGGDLPIFFELGEGPYFTDGDEYAEDPTISLLAGTEQPKPKDPAIS